MFGFGEKKIKINQLPEEKQKLSLKVKQRKNLHIQKKQKARIIAMI